MAAQFALEVAPSALKLLVWSAFGALSAGPAQGALRSGFRCSAGAECADLLFWLDLSLFLLVEESLQGRYQIITKLRKNNKEYSRANQD